jgi:hypothetical protein
MGFYFGSGDETKHSKSYSQFELKQRWEVALAANEFKRIFNTSLLQFVLRIVKVFSPPASTGFHFEFAPGSREQFATLLGARAFPPTKDLESALRAPSKPRKAALIPDDPGNTPDAAWRRLAAGNAIGASFREGGTGTSLHIAFSESFCDVHVDRHGFVVSEEGKVHWDVNGLLRHLTIDLAGDKVPRSLLSFGYVGRDKQPLFQATLSPWLAVDLPSRETGDRTAVKVGIALSGSF